MISLMKNEHIPVQTSSLRFANWLALVLMKLTVECPRLHPNLSIEVVKKLIWKVSCMCLSIKSRHSIWITCFIKVFIIDVSKSRVFCWTLLRLISHISSFNHSSTWLRLTWLALRRLIKFLNQLRLKPHTFESIEAHLLGVCKIGFRLSQNQTTRFDSNI